MWTQNEQWAAFCIVYSTLIKCLEKISGCISGKINLQSEQEMLLFIDQEAGVRDT